MTSRRTFLLGMAGILATATAPAIVRASSLMRVKTYSLRVVGGASSGWASELVYEQQMISEFIVMLRPMTIVSRELAELSRPVADVDRRELKRFIDLQFPSQERD